MEPDLTPSIPRRYLASVIDGFVLVIGYFSFVFGAKAIGLLSYWTVLFIFLIIFLYEPVLVNTSCTAGQLLMRIRVRDYSDQSKKISIISAIARTVVKAMLGIISFIMVSFSKDRRAIHDWAADSVMIYIGKSGAQNRKPESQSY